MKDRLTLFLQFEHLSPARFADILGVQRSGISHILSGRNKPGFDLIEKMLNKFPDLNAEWLITGKGKMSKEADSLLPQEKPSIQHPLPDAVNVKQLETTNKVSFDKHSISKIVILYNDKSFGEYHPE